MPQLEPSCTKLRPKQQIAVELQDTVRTVFRFDTET